MAEKDEAGIYYFQHDGGDSDELSKELVFLRHLVKEQKAEIAKLKEVVNARSKDISQ